MRTHALIRTTATAAAIVVSLVIWTLYRSVVQTDQSNAWVRHTQEVLAQVETVLGSLRTADANVHARLGDPTARTPEVLDRTDRILVGQLDRLAVLTADNPGQESRVQQLRVQTTQVLASLHQLTSAQLRGGPNIDDIDAERTALDAARQTARDIRVEEDQLLRERVDRDEAAVRRLQLIAGAVLLVSIGLLVAFLALMDRTLRRDEESAGALRHAKSDLEAEVRARTAELQDSSAHLQSIIDSAIDGIIVIGADGRVEAFNRGAEQLFGYPATAVIGRNVNMLMPSPYHEEHDRYLNRYLEGGQAKVIGTGREVTGRRCDGTTFPLHLSVGEMKIGGERKFTGVLHDLSVRVQMEEQLREQASLVRLGEMAAMLAHEIKNPLAGIRGAIQVIGGRLPAESRDVAVVKEVVSRIDGLNDLMKDLLLFARPPQPRLAAVDLPILVSSTATLLSADPALAELEVVVDGSVPIIDGDPELLKIVFGNLLVNGAHAMEGRGTIRVSFDVAESLCRIVVRDAGPGIPADIREKIFTPFFTTKTRGSGLGLPTVKRLIEAHHGSISIACPPEGGTTVMIQLPIAGSAAALA